MKLNRYLYILKMIDLALTEVSDLWILPVDVDDFVTLVKQYGKRGEITTEEVEYVIKTPLKDIYPFDKLRRYNDQPPRTL